MLVVDLTTGGFVAQELVPPGRRVVSQSPLNAGALKFDVRAYVYDSQIQHLVARVYNGQTTNMNTPGGGFAPVAVVPDIAWPGDADSASACRDCLHPAAGHPAGPAVFPIPNPPMT